MHKITQIIVVVIILIVLIWFFNRKYIPEVKSENSIENFKINSQNFVYNNAFEVSDRLDYGKNDDVEGMYKVQPTNPMGPSQTSGVGQNSGPASAKDVYDNSFVDFKKLCPKKTIVNDKSNTNYLEGASNLTFITPDKWVYENEGVT